MCDDRPSAAFDTMYGAVEESEYQILALARVVVGEGSCTVRDAKSVCQLEKRPFASVRRSA